MSQCKDCEHYKNSFDTDRHRKCPATGQRHWPGDNADECHHLMVRVGEEWVAC